MRSSGGTTTRDYRVSELLHWIHEGRIVLPEFQRDFDWADDRVTQLLATVIRRWPAGSLLLQEVEGETFYQLREIEAGPPVRREDVRLVVLDGQQRLTALYHAVFGAGDNLYAVRARALHEDLSIDQIEENIGSFSRFQWEAVEREGFDAENDWIPFASLTSPADFFDWRDQRADGSVESQDVARRLSDAYRHGLESFHTYSIPAVIVEEELEPAAIARIFERVNRGGLTLGAFDLMVAKTFTSGWNLRDRWSLAQEEFPRLREFFGEDGMPVIRVIALKGRNSVRQSDVLDLNGVAVRSDWKEAVRATDSALQFLQEYCGVQDPAWLPYKGMVVSLAGAALEHNLLEHQRTVIAWYLSRSFGLRYDSAANTVTVEEYHTLRRALEDPDFAARVPIPVAALRTATRKRLTASWRAFMSLLALNGARDPRTGQVLAYDVVDQTVLTRRPARGNEADPPHLLVLGNVVATRQTARILEEGALSTLLRLIADLDASTASLVRRSQFLEFLSDDTTEGQFVDQRAKALVNFLRDHGPEFDRFAVIEEEVLGFRQEVGRKLAEALPGWALYAEAVLTENGPRYDFVATDPDGARRVVVEVKSVEGAIDQRQIRRWIMDLSSRVEHDIGSFDGVVLVLGPTGRVFDGDASSRIRDQLVSILPRGTASDVLVVDDDFAPAMYRDRLAAMLGQR